MGHRFPFKIQQGFSKLVYPFGPGCISPFLNTSVLSPSQPPNTSLVPVSSNHHPTLSSIVLYENVGTGALEFFYFFNLDDPLSQFTRGLVVRRREGGLAYRLQEVTSAGTWPISNS
ncbi:hypothetical protein CEXT_309451 [Caerostris extrusa]|uniref:Uncharacterized protein n=1 Tax=Caerostris extrusa TaxID=172846 RepID=A0AAV4RIW9_CAEEX|nr:hypothetical protein CEXT_309451 [Caerostris extrusa]